MSIGVGIDDLNVYGSTLAVDAKAICVARGTPAEGAERLGLARRSLAPGYEDPVTLAANAARPLVDDHGKDAFELLVVATESGLDYAKPLGAYIHHHLGLTPSCLHLEMKHACFAATAGLELAGAWVLAHPKKRALVVATDMARRILGEPAEAAGGGAGAVAMVVATEPHVLELDGHRGFASREIYDVMRPTPYLERSYGDLSIAGYLDLLEIAWDGYRAAAGEGAFHRFDHMVFHTPVAPLVREAHRLLADAAGLDADAATEHFERCVRPSFRYCRELGNLYSGCLYAALAGLVDASPTLSPGARVGLYSYGSGSGASYFSGTLPGSARATLARRRIGAHLDERRVVDVATYERIVLENERSTTSAHFSPDRDVVRDHYAAAYEGRRRLVLEGVRDYERRYRWT